MEWYEQKLAYFCSYRQDQQHVIDIEEVKLLHLRAFTVFVQGSTTSKADAGQGIKPRKNEKIADLTVRGYVQVVKGFFSWCISERSRTILALDKLKAGQSSWQGGENT